MVIYLDNNATTFVRPEINEFMYSIYKYPYNASSTHVYGRQARNLIEDSRAKIQQAIGDEKQNKYRIIFTSSGTEANNLVIQNYQSNYAILVSAIEHSSILKAVESSHNLQFVEVDKQGLIKLNVLEEKLAETVEKKLVSIMFANNETGVIQNIKSIAKLVHKYQGLIHCDAVQGFSKEKIDINDLDVDMMTISAHKCGGPIGAACLIAKTEIGLQPILVGGAQEYNMRAGTENIGAIAGFGKVAENINENVIKMSYLKELRDYMEERIVAYASDAYIASQKAPRLSNTSCIIMPNMSSDTQLIHFDLAGIAIGNGSACTSGRTTKSHVLSALGFDNKEAGCAIRVSLGTHNTLEEIEIFIQEWKTLYDRSKTSNIN
ncbi:Cysteine desulfurase [Rickettsiales bacterium Ac37b]|nr:Cysteine desulfurase [Rickettsiales bacterium Ac37b]